jgi:hypothetical protein
VADELIQLLIDENPYGYVDDAADFTHSVADVIAQLTALRNGTPLKDLDAIDGPAAWARKNHPAQGRRSQIRSIGRAKPLELPAQPTVGEDLEYRQEFLPGPVVPASTAVDQCTPRRARVLHRPTVGQRRGGRNRIEAVHRWQLKRAGDSAAA